MASDAPPRPNACCSHSACMLEAAPSAQKRELSTAVPDLGLPVHVLELCLHEAGAWQAAGLYHGAWSVCRGWRDLIWRSPAWPDTLSRGMATHRPRDRWALLWQAVSVNANSGMVGPGAFIRAALARSHTQPDLAHALLCAARIGNMEAVRQLVEEHGVRADCHGGWALLYAAGEGRTEVVRYLLSCPSHAPRPDCFDSWAYVQAARKGHAEVVRLLLHRPQHASRADAQRWRALESAAEAGRVAVVRLLLEHAPPPDACERALRAAREWTGDEMGREAIVGLLQSAVATHQQREEQGMAPPWCCMM